MFHHELAAQTPYRSVASFPLMSRQRQRFGALDLYSTDPGGCIFRSLGELGAAVVRPIGLTLFDTPATQSDHGIAVPLWMTSASVARRNNVWVAVGMILAHGNISSTNALDLLRAYAFGHDISLDDTADQLSHQRLQPSAVLSS